MKKLLLSSLIITSIAVFAYTQTDVDNATYLAGKGIITSQSTTAGYRLDDTITRAEVAGIALKLRGTTLPEGYICKRYFGDVIRNDWICRAVELATDAGIVSRTNRVFRPQDKITKAEALAMLMNASRVETPSYSGGPDDKLPFYDTFSEGSMWQIDYILYASLIGVVYNPNVATIISSVNGEARFVSEMKPYYFYPNRSAKRSEVISFAKKILEYKAMMSGEVTVQ